MRILKILIPYSSYIRCTLLVEAAGMVLLCIAELETCSISCRSPERLFDSQSLYSCSPWCNVSLDPLPGTRFSEHVPGMHQGLAPPFDRMMFNVLQALAMIILPNWLRVIGGCATIHVCSFIWLQLQIAFYRFWSALADAIETIKDGIANSVALCLSIPISAVVTVIAWIPLTVFRVLINFVGGLFLRLSRPERKWLP